MAQSLRRVNFSGPDRAELWRRWRAGKSVSDIARVLRREPGTVHSLLSAAGGISPTARVRNERSLSPTEREEISRGLSAGVSVRGIATSLGRPPSTVSREVRRNGGRTAYRATEADTRAWSRARRPKVCKLSAEVGLRALVAKKLELDWSPEQIAGWLRVTFPERRPCRCLTRRSTGRCSSSPEEP